MNTLERRRIAKAQLIDVSVVKADLSQSRRQTADDTKKIRKDLAATRFAAKQRDTLTTPSFAQFN